MLSVEIIGGCSMALPAGTVSGTPKKVRKVESLRTPQHGSGFRLDADRRELELKFIYLRQFTVA